MIEFKAFICGKWIDGNEKMEVINPANGEICGIVPRCGEKEMNEAIEASSKAFEITKKSPTWQRVEVLKYIAGRIKEEKEAFARLIALEAGKPIKDARVEVDRAINTFTIASEEASRIEGDYIPLDTIPASAGRFGITKRFPRGPVAAISPFNFPLNLVAHKLAPAIACGNTVIMKPSSQTPMTSLKLAGIAGETDWPAGAVNCVPCSPSVAEILAVHPDIKVLSFTGSPSVGWHLKKLAYNKQVTLELGGNAGVIVHDDGNIDFAVKRCITGAFSFSGQVCISVQRIYVHKNVFDVFMDMFLSGVEKLTIGDPLDDKTEIGPLIDSSSMKKASQLITEAVEHGGKILYGGKHNGNYMEPTVLLNVSHDLNAYCEEAFAPLVCIEPYEDFDEALKLLDTSRFGLQCGIFTQDIKKIMKAYENVETGGVIINDIPTFRIDHMPYGGMKDSGFGREGIRYAIEEMTELKLLVLNMNS